jgi:putative transcriptional regulator
MVEIPGKPGFLLVASPELQDPNFARTVVLTITHDGEGSFGLVLNRPLTQTLGDVLPDVDERAASVRIYQGGPVQTEVLQVLSGSGPGRAIAPGIYLGVELEAMLDLDSDGHQLCGYMGYAGWGFEQLERETSEGSWIIAPARAAHVFDIPADQLWVEVLRELGGQYRWLTFEDGDPGMN